MWLQVVGSRQWLSEAVGEQLADEVERAIEAASESSEDYAEQLELEMKVAQALSAGAHVLAGSVKGAEVAYDFEAVGAAEPEASDFMTDAAQNSMGEDPETATDSESDLATDCRPQVRALPQQHKFRGSACLRPRERPWISKYHRWFKSMTADTFFSKISEQSGPLGTYTEETAKLDMSDAQADRVVPKTARMLQEQLRPIAYSRPCQVADLGCGSAELAREIAAIDWHGQQPEMTSVDAVQLALGVLAHNISALPEDWKGRFDVAVLCRALWRRDYMRVLMEARRIFEA